ncbi:unnamed protein product, partial [Didymodactylos carnosus]
FVPAITFFVGQKARINFGQDVNSLKYFTSCGLQEGYEPFCVNMSKNLTFWYSNFIPCFADISPNSTSLEIIRIGASRDNSPSIKLVSKLFGTLDAVQFEFLRLSLPLACHDKFTPKHITQERKQIALNEFLYQQEEKASFSFPVLSSTTRRSSLTPGTTDTINSLLTTTSDLTTNSNFLSPDGVHATTESSPLTTANKGLRNPANLLVKFKDSSVSKKKSSSPQYVNGDAHLLIDRSDNQTVTNTQRSKSPGKKLNHFLNRFAKDTARTDLDNIKSSKHSAKHNSANINSNVNTLVVGATPPQSALKPPPSLARKSSAIRRSFIENENEETIQTTELDTEEIQATADHIHEYYYSIRIFSSQDPKQVYIGWITSKFRPILQDGGQSAHSSSSSPSSPSLNTAALSPSEKLSKLVRKCTITQTAEDGSILESVTHSDSYMFSAWELLETMPDTEAVARRVTNGLLIGCVCDVSTGQLTFYVNGKESAQKLQVEPGIKLYPAVFFQPTAKEILQFELGRIKGVLPLTAALFPSLGKEERCLPRLQPRLHLQALAHCHWSRVPNVNIRYQQLKLSDLKGWSVFCEDPVQMEAVYVPEEDRCTDILSLVENEDNLNFCANTLTLYNAICAQGNNRAAHEVCKLVDEKQLMHCIKDPYLCGSLRVAIHNLLIALHFEPHVRGKSLTINEFIIPLSASLKKNALLRTHESFAVQKPTTYIPPMENFLSVRPKLIKEEDIKSERERKLLVPPPFNVTALKEYVMSSITDAVEKSAKHLRDPVGGSYSNCPLLQLIDALLVMGLLDINDIQQLLILIDPVSFEINSQKEGLSNIDEGLLQMKLDEPVKLQMCFVLHHLCDYQLQYHIEAIVAFSEEFVAQVQVDQKRRYNVLKESSLPPALMAKKTKEFRCPPKDQMQALMNFKRNDDDALIGNEDMQEEIKETLKNFHSNLLFLQQVQLTHTDSTNTLAIKKQIDPNSSLTIFERLLQILIQQLMKKNNKANELINKVKSLTWKRGKTLCEVIKKTLIEWGYATHINDPNLIREIFKLLYRQYDGIGEISRCLEKTYTISAKSIRDITQLLRQLSTVRALLTVQMDADEEEIMIRCLNDIIDNKVFYQHPDLMRSLCVHETVMAIMVNRLNKSKQEQSSMSDSNDINGLMSTMEGENLESHIQKEDKVELVTTCCKFLSYFCRTSRHNQRAMFEHLSYLLENSSMLLSRPSLRGSSPLDVASASVMDNNELALALRESHLEKIASYLSRCGTTRNEQLILQGYHDIGWDPVEGERFLDFLKFCVWVNGDTVEENADLVVRLLIRHPDCLGPALRGEGGGLLKAIKEGIAQSLYIARRQNPDDPLIQLAYQEMMDDESMHSLNDEYDRLQVRLPYEDDEDYIDLGAAELSFYAILVELLGRCAPSEETIKMGKPNAIRAKSILKSLVSMGDLEGVLGLKFLLSNEESMPSGLQPTHKMSIILFLERVYGIPDQETYFRLLEDAFLPDIRAVTVLDMATASESDMALALNRYICNCVIPLMTNQANYFDDSDHRSSLLESTLHTVYRLSKCRSLTKNQLDAVCDFLLAFANTLKPSMMTPLLRILIYDVPALTNQTIVPLRMLTQWYERCGRYYSTSATEEEKRLTMMLFQKIFDALASRAYDPELFSKALPCLSAIGSALPPDYSYSISAQDNINYAQEQIKLQEEYEPNPVDITGVSLSPHMEEFVKAYAESVHDQWSYAKIEQGWSYGEQINDKYRQHPNIRPYKTLDRKDQIKIEEPIRDALKAVEKLKFHLEKTDSGSTRMAIKPIQRKKQKDIKASDYFPRAVDFSSMTLTREMEDLARALEENAHEMWTRQLKNRLYAVGGGLHPRLVPYALLTDKEKQKNYKFYQELIKYLHTFGYHIIKINEQNTLASSLSPSHITEKRFAFSLLEKLLEYVERAAHNMQNYKESSKFSLHESYCLSTKDVKFFGKVVLPLVERYFQAQRHYFIMPASLKTGVGYASVKEKEMSCSLFCKLASLLRQKFTAFGNDVNISVRCLKVLVRAIDVSSVMKNSQEMVRASLLPLFNNIAEDLYQTVQNLQHGRYSQIKGTLQRGATSLSYINMVLLPILSSMLDHLGKNQYGVDVFENEIQLSGYKILNALWITSKQGIKFVNRHRPLIGECLSAFAACFPVAFFEPELNRNNKHASNVSQLSPEAQDVMTEVAQTIPHLTKVIADIEEHVDSGSMYDDAPYLIEVVLPCVCSYLSFWWNYGPQKVKQTDSTKITNVTSEHMNSVLGSVLKLINNNIDTQDAPWMKRIAVYTQAIILNSSTSLLEKYFLPVSQRLKLKCDVLYFQEENLKHATRLESSDREDLETSLMKNYEILVRDVYAFGPLLVKYVDLHRSSWLKNADTYANELYNNMAEIFSTWCKSKFFKREELNFVTQHEIDNTSMLMPGASGTSGSSAGNNTSSVTSTSNTVGNACTTPNDMMKNFGDLDSGGGGSLKQKRRKRRMEKEKFTSLSVACIKRLLPIGMNMFGGREQELIQLAKHKLIEDDQEEAVQHFLREILYAQGKDEMINKKNWQSLLYRRIGSKSTGVAVSPEESIKNILKMAKVLFGLHLVDHPPTHRHGTGRKLMSSQRKKAVMACFRMAPLHSVPRHRAMNMFLRAYQEIWLEAEEDTRARLIENLCADIGEQNDIKQEITIIKEEAETETTSLTLTLTFKPDALKQLLQCLNRSATAEHLSLFNITDDIVYLSYATIMSKSCVISDDDDDDGTEEPKSFQEQEMEKQKLLYEQNRLATRGAAETVLLYISASKGENNDMLQRTLQLGISLLHGGNKEVQTRMLAYLKETKDVGFFTSLATLMANCSVLDLDTFERCIKAEVLGVGSDGMAGEKNLHDADFTISLFRFCQLLCEGHNLAFQNYLRSQAGSNTNVNVIICTVDYLLSLQESIMDFYWYYSGKETVDAHGKENFCRAINVAKQVFNTLTEYIQGPCPQNQLALANSRLWDAIAGFLHIFAHLQRKLSRDPLQIELLRELMKLQKDMIVMLLSMLEGKQMVDTLIESQPNVELLLQFFDIFLKMKGLTTSEAFQEFDTNNDGFISPKEFRRAMEAQKMYTTQDIDYILMCVDTNQDGKIDFMEFTERFHNPAKDIGFNMAVLLTNLSEHMPHDARLQRLMDKAKSFLSYFQEYLGRIEIKGGAGYIERVYFEIREGNIEQWNKKHIKESKKQFLHFSVNETDDKEKLEQFINFCEDTIFEMEHAASLSGEEQNPVAQVVRLQSETGLMSQHSMTIEPIKIALSFTWKSIKSLFHLLKPSTIRASYLTLKQMTLLDIGRALMKLSINLMRFSFMVTIHVLSLHVFIILKFLLPNRHYYYMAFAFQHFIERLQLIIFIDIINTNNYNDYKSKSAAIYQPDTSYINNNYNSTININNRKRSLFFYKSTITPRHRLKDILKLPKEKLKVVQYSRAIRSSQSSNYYRNVAKNLMKRMLTYCLWNLLTGEPETVEKIEVAAPSTKCRDQISAQFGFNHFEETTPINAFGIGFSSDAPLKPKMSIAPNDRMSLLNFDNDMDAQAFEEHMSLSINTADRRTRKSISTRRNTRASLVTPQMQVDQQTIIATIPGSQLTTTVHMQPQNIEKTKSALDEYEKKQIVNIEEDDIFQPEPPPKSDYSKKIMAFVARNYHTLKFIALILAFIINFLMLFYKAIVPPSNGVQTLPDEAITREYEDENEVIMIDPKNYYMNHLLRSSAFLHSCVAFLMMISYYKLKVPLVIFKREKEVARKLEFEGAWLTVEAAEDNPWIISYLSREWHKLVISSKSFPDSYWDKFVKKKVRNKYCDQFDYDELSKFLGMEKSDTPHKFEILKQSECGFWGKLLAIDWRYQLWKWGVIFTDNSFLYVFFYFLFSVIGNYNYFVFAGHLLDVAISIKALSTILKSITHNGRQLMLTIMLMAVLVYLYTVVAFNFFRKFYTKEEDNEIEQNCKDMFTCFKFHLYSGIRAGGGIGDELESPNGDPLEFYRIIFDITFFFFIIVILLAIIQGLIIDAFGDLREQLDSVKSTLESKCFICGIGQEYFDKEPHGFEVHTTKEHNFANYMFFLTHLLNKPDTEHTGQESYVWELYQKRDWNFFPVGDCFRRQYEPGGSTTDQN